MMSCHCCCCKSEQHPRTDLKNYFQFTGVVAINLLHTNGWMNCFFFKNRLKYNTHLDNFEVADLAPCSMHS